jgi:hypothetical protein
MVQVDVFRSHAIGAGSGVAAARPAPLPAEDRSARPADRYLSTTVLARLLRGRGPAGRLAAAFRIDPAAERHPLPAATTARTA